MVLDNVINNIVNEVLQEKISRQQKEAGAKAMDGINLDPFTQLKRAFNWRWKDRGELSVKERKQKFVENKRLAQLLKKIGDKKEKERIANVSDKQTQEYIKSILGKIPEFVVNSNFGNSLTDNGEEISVSISPNLSKDNRTNEYFVDGFNFGKTIDKNIEKAIRKFIIGHEYGHLFNYLDTFVRTGKAGKIVDTFRDNVDEVVDSEGKANTYSIANLNRYDKRNIIKKTGFSREEAENSKDKLRRWKNGTPEKLTYQDLYKIGTYDKYGHSIDRINSSIKKEKEHFEEEVNYFPY